MESVALCHQLGYQYLSTFCVWVCGESNGFGAKIAKIDNDSCRTKTHSKFTVVISGNPGISNGNIFPSAIQQHVLVVRCNPDSPGFACSAPRTSENWLAKLCGHRVFAWGAILVGLVLLTAANHVLFFLISCSNINRIIVSLWVVFSFHQLFLQDVWCFGISTGPVHNKVQQKVAS